MIKFTFKQWLGAFAAAGSTFRSSQDNPDALIAQMVELSAIARKDGMLALENVEIEYGFLKQGVRMLIDGSSREVVGEVLYKDRQQFLDRQTWGHEGMVRLGRGRACHGHDWHAGRLGADAGGSQ